MLGARHTPVRFGGGAEHATLLTSHQTSGLPVHSDLRIVNPTLATLDLRFEPSGAANDHVDNSDDSIAYLNEVSDVVAAGAQDNDSGLEGWRDVRIPFALQLQTGSIASMGLFESGGTASGDTGGWADGYERRVLTIPGMQWQTDWNSHFSLRISSQTWRESTDIGVMGMFSVEF